MEHSRCNLFSKTPNNFILECSIQNVVLYYPPMLRHDNVKILSDNGNACSIIQRGSTKPLRNDTDCHRYFPVVSSSLIHATVPSVDS